MVGVAMTTFTAQTWRRHISPLLESLGHGGDIAVAGVQLVCPHLVDRPRGLRAWARRGLERRGRARARGAVHGRRVLEQAGFLRERSTSARIGDNIGDQALIIIKR